MCNLRTSILCDGVTGRNSVEHGSVSYEKYVEGCNLNAEKYQGYSDVHRDRIEQPGYKML